MLVFRVVLFRCFFWTIQIFPIETGEIPASYVSLSEGRGCFFPKKLWIFPVPKNQRSNPPKKRGGWTSIARGVCCILQIARAIAVPWFSRHDKINFFSNVRKSLAICDVQGARKAKNVGFSHHFRNIWAMNKYFCCLGYIEDCTYPDMWGL